MTALKCLAALCLISRGASGSTLERAQALMDSGRYEDAGTEFAQAAVNTHSREAAEKACSCLTLAKNPQAKAWCAYAAKLSAAAPKKPVPAPPDEAGEAQPRRQSSGHPELDYNPAPPEATLEQRQASWESMRVRGFDDRDFAEVGDHFFKATEQGHYYKNAGAEDAFALYRKGQTSRTHGIIWVAAATGGGAIAGYLGGTIYGLNQYSSRYSSTTNTYAYEADAYIGLLCGALIGLTLGGSMAVVDSHERSGYRKDAAKSFNEKLWRDLRLDAQPLPGGAKVGVHEDF